MRSLPIQLGWNEKIHVESFGRMEIDARSIFHMTLETTTHTAPEAAVLSRIKTISTRLQWCKIAYHTCHRVLLTEDMIIERPLIVIGYLAAWIPGKEMIGKFQKIEGTAILTIIT